MRFEFLTAGRVIFGAGALREAAPLAASWGLRALLVTGREAGRAAGLLEALRAAGVEAACFAVSGEPTTGLVQQAAARARDLGADMVIGLGGGSALDTGKAAAALLTNPGDLLDYLEVIGRGRPLAHPSAPYLAIPTTAGTGSEVTRNAVLASPEHRLKVSLRGPGMLPRAALVDPELTHGLPPAVTASTGLDALTQLIEPYVCSSPSPLVDALCREAIPRAARALPRAYAYGQDPAARADMALASLLGGMALANARLGAVHGLAAPIGGMFPAAHGAVCARLLPRVMEANLRALQSRAPDSPVLERYADVARWLTGRPAASAADGVRWVEVTSATLQVPPLARYGLRPDDLPAIVAQAQQASSMKGNPLPLSDAELAGLLRQAL